MALYGALAENTRRNERVERGSLAVTGSATLALGTITATANIAGPMRMMTSFFLQIDDGGTLQNGIVGTASAAVTGSLNAAGTVLTINVTAFTSTSNPTLIASTVATTIRWQVWGNLAAISGPGGF